MRFPIVRLLMSAVVVLFTACDAGNVSDPAGVRVQRDDIPGSDGRNYHAVSGNIPLSKMTASAWIDRKGGFVTLDGPSINGRWNGHAIYVPENAVKERTLFTIAMEPGDGVAAQLTAKVQERNGTWTDVGAQGFRKPVYLILSYAGATTAPDVQRLKVALDPQNGAPHQIVKTYVFTGDDRFIAGELPHFSRWVMVND